MVGRYLVIVTDTGTTDPFQCHRHPPWDDTISIRLPNSRLLDYADQTTITVLLAKDKSAVAGLFIAVTDKHDNYCEDTTNASGQITVPGTPARPMRTVTPPWAGRTRTATAGR